jgi:hypothetical protein
LRLLLRSPRRLWTCANHPLLRRDSIKLADSGERTLSDVDGQPKPFRTLMRRQASTLMRRQAKKQPFSRILPAG